MKVIISGGGTGGHIYPGIAIARQLMEKYSVIDILFVGTPKGLESTIIPEEGFEFTAIDLQGFRRKISVDNIITLLKAGCAFVKSYHLLKKERPNVVIGTGGYVCGPVLLCAAIMGIPTLIQEQNAIPGRTSKMLSRFVQKVAAGYDESEKYFSNPERVVVTGNPIRPEIISTRLLEGIKAMGLKVNKKTLLVFGASQGSRTINDVMLEAASSLKTIKGLQVLWITGPYDYERVINKVMGGRGIQQPHYGNIIIKSYINNMEYAYAACDFVICRGGAISLAEITARGIPAIIVPYPYATDNHQEYNAKALVKRGAAFMILDKDLNANTLMEHMKLLVENPDRANKMRKSSLAIGKPDAGKHIVNMIDQMLN